MIYSSESHCAEKYEILSSQKKYSESSKNSNEAFMRQNAVKA